MTKMPNRRAVRLPAPRLPTAARLMALPLLLAAAAPTFAAQVQRDDFGPDAVNFGFDVSGEPSLTDEFLSTSDAVVTDQNGDSIGVEWGNFEGANAIGGNDIRFDFAEPVSAFGVDFIANDTCSFRFYEDYPTLCGGEMADTVTLSIFGALGQLIQSLVFGLSSPVGNYLVVGDQGAPADFPYGFAGLSAGTPVISYATFTSDLPSDFFPIRVDNAIYEPGPTSTTPAAPEPATAALLSAALVGMGLARRRRKER